MSDQQQARTVQVRGVLMEPQRLVAEAVEQAVSEATLELPPNPAAVPKLLRRREAYDLADRAALTPKEWLVMLGIAHGYTNGELADRMMVSPKTVATLSQRIKDRTGLRTNIDIALQAYCQGLITWPRQEPPHG